MAKARIAKSGSRVKERLAHSLRAAILSGRLAPGQRVVEGLWSRKFSVAQASVREAINLLIAEGFLLKGIGRSARVVQYSEQDVERVYQVRAALEGMAASLACTAHADLSPMTGALHTMISAAKRHDMRALVAGDLRYHLCLAEAAGNPLLAEILRRLLTPLFAFALLRALKRHQGPGAWTRDIPSHRRMIEIIREGNPLVAQHYVQHSVRGFAASANSIWETSALLSASDISNKRRKKSPTHK
jgi:DNA-binding GntR family transcriptional regulator